MEKVVVGVIGAGRIGKLHINNLKSNPRVRLKMAADINMEQLQDCFKDGGIEEITKEYQDVFQDEEIDAVFICSPTSTHMEMIKLAAQYKKHIFCEKPISLSEEETLAAYSLIEEARIKMQVGFNRRFDKNFAEMKNRIEKNDIGDVHILKITSRDPKPPHAGYIETSGGLFMDMTIHDFDMARNLVGSEIVEVFAQGANLVDPTIGEKGDIDTAVISLKFENGALGIIDNSREAVYGYDQRIEVFGNKGVLLADNETETNLKHLHVNTTELDNPRPFFLERYQEAFIKEMEEFVESILENREVSVRIREAILAQRIALAAQASYETAQPVTVDHKITL